MTDTRRRVRAACAVLRDEHSDAASRSAARADLLQITRDRAGTAPGFDAAYALLHEGRQRPRPGSERGPLPLPLDA